MFSCVVTNANAESISVQCVLKDANRFSWITKRVYLLFYFQIPFDSNLHRWMRSGGTWNRFIIQLKRKFPYPLPHNRSILRFRRANKTPGHVTCADRGYVLCRTHSVRRVWLSHNSCFCWNPIIISPNCVVQFSNPFTQFISGSERVKKKIPLLWISHF